MKLQLVQMDVRPGHPSDNTTRMLNHIATARDAGVGIVVFPEMVIPGYLLGDTWERESFLRECQSCGDKIKQASDGITVIFGNIAMDWDKKNEDGRVRKYNALYVAENGKFIGPENGPYPFVIKTLLPNYREFDDSRHFHDLRKLAVELKLSAEALIQPVSSRHGRLGCMLCEDGWDTDYALSPFDSLAEETRW